MANGNIIGISFDAMDDTKKKIRAALAAAEAERDYINRAISSLSNTDDGRLRQKAEELRSMRANVDKRISELQRLERHIDYAVRRFKEVDSECAKRISSKGYEKKSISGLDAIGPYGGLYGGMLPISASGAMAWQKYRGGGLGKYDSSFKEMAERLWKPNDFSWSNGDIDWTEDAINRGWGPITEEEYKRRQALMFLYDRKAKETGKVDDPNVLGALIKGATGYDSYVSYASGAAEKTTQIVADQIYHSVVSNSSSKVEAYGKLLNIANKADAVRSLSGPIKAIGKWGGVAGSAIGGAIDVYGDINNPDYNDDDKVKAITVDVVATGASIGAGLILVAALPASIPILAGIAIGVGVSAVISYSASAAKDYLID